MFPEIRESELDTVLRSSQALIAR